MSLNGVLWYSFAVGLGLLWLIFRCREILCNIFVLVSWCKVTLNTRHPALSPLLRPELCESAGVGPIFDKSFQPRPRNGHTEMFFLTSSPCRILVVPAIRYETVLKSRSEPGGGKMDESITRLFQGVFVESAQVRGALPVYTIDTSVSRLTGRALFQL